MSFCRINSTLENHIPYSFRLFHGFIWVSSHGSALEWLRVFCQPSLEQTSVFTTDLRATRGKSHGGDQENLDTSTLLLQSDSRFFPFAGNAYRRLRFTGVIRVMIILALECAPCARFQRAVYVQLDVSPNEYREVSMSWSAGLREWNPHCKTDTWWFTGGR